MLKVVKSDFSKDVYGKRAMVVVALVVYTQE